MIPTVLFVLAAWAVTLAAAYCVGRDRGEREGRGEADMRPDARDRHWGSTPH